MLMSQESIKTYIRKRRHLFGWVKEETKIDLSKNAVVETLLNYGHVSDIQQLFDLIGIEKVSKIFYEQISRKRMNYHPRTVHFFKHYFERHVPRDSHG